MNESSDPIELGLAQRMRRKRTFQRGFDLRVTGRLFRVTSEYSHGAGLNTNCREFHATARAFGRTCPAFVARPRSFMV